MSVKKLTTLAMSTQSNAAARVSFLDGILS